MRTRSDSTGFAVNEAKALAEPLPLPPQRLDDAALQYWPAVVNAKRRTAWTDSDLLLACQLARDLAAIDDLSADLEKNGRVLLDNKGKRYGNPAANLLDQANRRIISTSRALQVHALASTGRVIDQGKKNEAARTIAAKIDAADDDLIARVFN